jgi:hypothetical protein
MEDKKHYYTIHWQQSYNTWPSKQWLDEAVDAIVEAALEHSDYAEACRVIERAKQ